METKKCFSYQICLTIIISVSGENKECPACEDIQTCEPIICAWDYPNGTQIPRYTEGCLLHCPQGEIICQKIENSTELLWSPINLCESSTVSTQPSGVSQGITTILMDHTQPFWHNNTVGPADYSGWSLLFTNELYITIFSIVLIATFCLALGLVFACLFCARRQRDSVQLIASRKALHHRQHRKAVLQDTLMMKVPSDIKLINHDCIDNMYVSFKASDEDLPKYSNNLQDPSSGQSKKMLGKKRMEVRYQSDENELVASKCKKVLDRQKKVKKHKIDGSLNKINWYESYLHNFVEPPSPCSVTGLNIKRSKDNYDHTAITLKRLNSYGYPTSPMLRDYSHKIVGSSGCSQEVSPLSSHVNAEMFMVSASADAPLNNPTHSMSGSDINAVLHGDTNVLEWNNLDLSADYQSHHPTTPPTVEPYLAQAFTSYESPLAQEPTDSSFTNGPTSTVRIPRI